MQSQATLLPCQTSKSLLSNVKYKFDNNSKTKNRTKKAHSYKNFDQNIAHLLFYCFTWGKKLPIFLTQKLLKVIIYQKLRIAQKKLFMRKMSARSIPIYPANLVIFEESWIFGGSKHPCWTPVVPKRDMMWCKILRPSFFKAHWASFMSRRPLLRGWRGLF